MKDDEKILKALVSASKPTSWKPQSQPKQDHDCPTVCARLLGQTYVSCQDEALTPEEIKAAKFCPTDKHRFEDLPIAADGHPVARCMRCGCWNVGNDAIDCADGDGYEQDEDSETEEELRRL